MLMGMTMPYPLNSSFSFALYSTLLPKHTEQKALGATAYSDFVNSYSKPLRPANNFYYLKNCAKKAPAPAL
jgi:hypothetical protein